MDRAKYAASMKWAIPGLILQIGGRLVLRFMQNPSPTAVGLGWGVSLAGTVLLIVGLVWLAMAKGQHRAWGLAGLLSLLGVFVVAVLPDRKR